MPLTVNDFSQAANATWFGSRDIVISSDSNKAKLGRFLFSKGKASNDAAMNAFREALSRKHGVFGEHAFDTILGDRKQFHKSLRACDVKAVLSSLAHIRENRFMAELNRQLDTNPQMLELAEEVGDAVRREIASSPLAGRTISPDASSADITRMASERISEALAEVCDGYMQKTGHVPAAEEEKADYLEQPAKPEEPTGLRNLKVTFSAGSTSVADRIKNGTLGVGMTINRSASNAMILEKLKTNGVEPGFICRRDWSRNDTRSMMADMDSQESLDALESLKKQHPDIAEQCKGLPLRGQVMLFGRAHPAGMAAVAEFVLEKGMEDENSAIYKAFCDKFPGTPPEQWKTMDARVIKNLLFAEIRDAAMGVKPGDASYGASPVFRQFNERHIVKLDYNESDRIVEKSTASAGRFMRPERILQGRKPVLGHIYRLQTATTADDSSAGAVTEALANDLTRLAGVPSQELMIVRGQYSDGHPKIMLQAKFAEGYKDLEAGYIKDGQVVPPGKEKVESLGKYKAFFLVTADRDAVGSRGQNKGYAKGKFFAIDPGHSLEGNSRYLEVEDDFSFRDTYGASTKPRFRNFSVFDDDTRFAKFQGALGLRTLKESGKIEKLFDDYRKAFDPRESGIPPEEKVLRNKIQAEIAKKEKEFSDSLAKVLTAAENQLALYDDLADMGPEVQEKAIETMANLEKLTSPTTWVSPKGEVPLKHLAVIPGSRIPWRAYADGDNIVYHCDSPLSVQSQEHLRAFAGAAGASLFIDGEGCATLAIPKLGAERSLDVFSESHVANVTHAAESAARAMGGTGLAEAATYVPPPLPMWGGPVAFELPQELTVRIGGEHFTFRRQHYEAMLASTPPELRPKSVQELKAVLAARIRRGKSILFSVYSGNGHRYAATPRNVACVTLALHAGTVKKGEYNDRGAFSVADPEGQLYKWLDTSKELYMRTSTHATAYHRQTVDGHMNMPRGLGHTGRHGRAHGRHAHHPLLHPAGSQRAGPPALPQVRNLRHLPQHHIRCG